MTDIRDKLAALTVEQRAYLVGHLPRHADERRLHRLLTDHDFLEAKVALLGPEPLIEE